MSLGFICSSKLTVFLELRSPETVPFSEQTSADKYPRTASRQIEAILYLPWKQNCRTLKNALGKNGLKLKSKVLNNDNQCERKNSGRIN